MWVTIRGNVIAKILFQGTYAAVAISENALAQISDNKKKKKN